MTCTSSFDQHELFSSNPFESTLGNSKEMLDNFYKVAFYFLFHPIIKSKYFQLDFSIYVKYTFLIVCLINLKIY